MGAAHGYTCTVAARFHILLTDEQYDCLASEANRTGLPMAELLRRALDRVYRPELRPRAGGLELSVGLWRRPDAAVAGRRPGIRLSG
jgi:hypothetical protein